MNRALVSNIEDLTALLKRSEVLEPKVVAAADIVLRALQSGHKMLACGNGGSAADAAHLTTEFVSRFNHERRPYPAIALTVHGGDLTAIGNDYDFNDVFERQIRAFGQKDDVLICFSSSGQSENIRRALVASANLQMSTIAFLGKSGGVCKGLADVELLVDGQTTARVQEVQKLLLHTMCELVDDGLVSGLNL